MSIPAETEITPDYIFGMLTPDSTGFDEEQRLRRGLWHTQRLQPLDPAPGDPITITVGAGPDILADHVTLYYTTDGALPSGSFGQARVGVALQMQRVGVEWDLLVGGYRDTWQGVIPPQPAQTRVQYIIEAWHSRRPEIYHAGKLDKPQVYGFYIDTAQVPGWLRDAVIYQIFIDRFAPETGRTLAPPRNAPDGFYGGTLRGIISRLDYLADLGATCLWLSPIFPSPTYHGYDATDYSTVEPRLGSDADAQLLFNEAHRRGIRVLLDYVASHVSNQHPAFAAAQQDPHCPTAAWFRFDHWPDRYDTFFGVQTMPKLNTDQPAARSYLIEQACRWLAAGCDGFRLDHVNGPSLAFWSAFRVATQAVKPDSVLFGEDVEAPVIQRAYIGRMDGCLDFLLHQGLRKFFSFNTLTPGQFDAFLQRHLAYFPQNYIQPSFLDNHDLNRFLWTARGDKRRLRMAALCQFTLPGPPIIYYGTEVGLSQQRNVGALEEARLPMPWGRKQDTEMLAFYKALIALRHQGGPVWRGPRQTLLVDDERGFYAYTCGPYTVVFNHSAEAVIIPLPDSSAAELALGTTAGVCWRNGALTLPPFSGACLAQI